MSCNTLALKSEVGNKIVITHFLGYYGDNSPRPKAAPSDSDYYQP